MQTQLLGSISAFAPFSEKYMCVCVLYVHCFSFIDWYPKHIQNLFLDKKRKKFYSVNKGFPEQFGVALIKFWGKIKGEEPRDDTKFPALAKIQLRWFLYLP